MKQILPPDLRPFDRERYVQDLEYRLMIDLEDAVERHDHLRLLLRER